MGAVVAIKERLMKAQQQKPFQLSLETIVLLYGTDLHKGLTSQQAEERRRSYGPNQLREAVRASWFTVFLRQFNNPLMYILIAAAVSIFLVDTGSFDACIIVGILLFNALIGTLQEGRTASIASALRRFVPHTCSVMRDGIAMLIDSKDLVPGDLIVLSVGQRIPADVRLTDVNQCRIDESMLTGESQAVQKHIMPIAYAETQVADQLNMAFAGTYIVRGSARGIVVATGNTTNLGSIRTATDEVHQEIPMERELYRLSWSILLSTACMCLLLVVIGMYVGHSYKELLTTIIALFMCTVPEGLPIVLTLILVRGAYQMAKRHVLVKNMRAIETLGRVTMVVTDKTGTLTMNQMVVSDLFVHGAYWRMSVAGKLYPRDTSQVFAAMPDDLCQLGIALSLLRPLTIDVYEKPEACTILDPTDSALARAGANIGPGQDTLAHAYTLISHVPFDASLQYQAGLYRHKESSVLYCIGAPEILMAASTAVHDAVRAALEEYTAEGLRVLAVASTWSTGDDRSLETMITEKLPLGMQFLGLIGIQDAIRTDVAGAIREAQAAGIRVVMATGDHVKTARFVAQKTGILNGHGTLIEGTSYTALGAKARVDAVPAIAVYARVAPQDKLAIVTAAKKAGYLVAMAGDGVNDAPALVAADVGIAMGLHGSDVAHEVADIILLKDSFTDIIEAISYGRYIIHTLRRVIVYFFATNMAEVLLIVFAMVYSCVYKTLTMPLTAAQILWLNLITDGFLDMAIAMEPYKHSIRERQKHVVDYKLLSHSLFMALPMACGSFLIYVHYTAYGPVYARTACLIAMASFQLLNAWNCRSENLSLVKMGCRNRWLIGATVCVIVLQLALIYLPVLNTLFCTVPLNITSLLVIIGLSLIMIFIEEIRKKILQMRLGAK